MKVKIIEAIERFQDDAKIRHYEIHLNYKSADSPNDATYIYPAYLVGISKQGKPIFEHQEFPLNFITFSKEEVKHLILKD